MKYLHLSILLFANLILADQQVKLEDIERDNLANERDAQSKDVLIAQQTQHLRPPSIHAPNQFSIQVHHDGSGHHDGGNGGGGAVSSVSYHSGPSAPATQGTAATYAPTGHGQVQYVTPTPSTYQHKDIISYTPQVHEADRTYAVPSRQSLINPTIGGGIPTNKYFTPQPQYVYVQAQPQPQLQSYVQPQPFQQPQVAYQQQQLYVHQQPQAYVMVPSYVQSHVPFILPKLQAQQYQQHQLQPQALPQQQHQHQPQYQQHLQQSIPAVLSYSHGTSGQHGTGTVVTASTPKPTVSYVSSTAAPVHHHDKNVGIVKSVSPIQYSLQTTHNTGSSYHQHLQQHQHGQQYNTATGAPLQYIAHQPQQLQHQHISPPVQVQPIINHVPQIQYQQSYAAPALQYHQQAAPLISANNYYGAYHQNREPTSLLDSYIPSSVLYARQKGLVHAASPYTQYAAAASSPIYNTIAYSVPNYQFQPSVQTAQNTLIHPTHFKRSPNPTTSTDSKA